MSSLFDNIPVFTDAQVLFPDKEKEPASTSAPKTGESKEKIALRLGRHIGGSRLDRAGARKTAVETGEIVGKDEAIPAWRKNFIIVHLNDDMDSRLKARIEKYTLGIEKDKSPFLRNPKGKKWFVASIEPKSWTAFRLQGAFKSREEAEIALPILAVGQRHIVSSELKGGWAPPPEYTNGDSFHDYAKPEDFEYFIVRLLKTKPSRRVAGPFASEAEADEYLGKNAVDILNWRPEAGYGEALLFTAGTSSRNNAPQYRQGDVKPEQFMSAFGFRGVEFGLWNKQADRQKLLNLTYDSLMDLASLLKISPESLSLEGTLGLAFGARGHGQYPAHYEPEHTVINLTKPSGAGALAHEWFHALDNYLHRLEIADHRVDPKTDTVKNHSRDFDGFSQGLGSTTMLTEDCQAENSVFPLRSLFKQKTISHIPKQGEIEAHQRSRTEQKLLLAETWNRMMTKAFAKASSFDLQRLEQFKEDIFAGKALAVERKIVITSSPRGGKRRYRRSTNDILEEINNMMLVKLKKPGFGARTAGILDEMAAIMQNYHEVQIFYDHAVAGKAIPTVVHTDFYMNAVNLDRGRSQAYWTKPCEMGARAFCAFINDRMADQGMSNTFLASTTNNDYFKDAAHSPKPYPEGEERLTLNAKFEELFLLLRDKNVLKDAHRELFQPAKTMADSADE
jgi:hypothetical protein